MSLIHRPEARPDGCALPRLRVEARLQVDYPAGVLGLRDDVRQEVHQPGEVLACRTQ